MEKNHSNDAEAQVGSKGILGRVGNDKPSDNQNKEAEKYHHAAKEADFFCDDGENKVVALLRQVVIVALGSLEEALAEETSRQVALAALKYGDLSNQASKDYIFDIDKFTSFEGDTGPYILYTIVRMRSILQRYAEQADAKDPASLRIGTPAGDVEKKLMMDLAGFNAMIEGAYADYAPHRVCAWIYQVSNDFNSFYHATRILTEQDPAQKEAWIALLSLTERILTRCIDLLGFSAPVRM